MLCVMTQTGLALTDLPEEAGLGRRLWASMGGRGATMGADWEGPRDAGISAGSGRSWSEAGAERGWLGGPATLSGLDSDRGM